MERKDISIIQKHATNDKVLDLLYKEHLSFEKQLEKLDRKPFLTREEEHERKELQKRKLLGKDKLEIILRKYRNGS